MIDEQDDAHDLDDEHDHEHDHPDLEDLYDLGLESPTQVFLELRGQNLELLKLAAQVAGFGGSHSPLKPADQRQAMKAIWDFYTEFYGWIDPEEADEEDDEEDDE
jgi:hypothetical protein